MITRIALVFAILGIGLCAYSLTLQATDLRFSIAGLFCSIGSLLMVRGSGNTR